MGIVDDDFGGEASGDDEFGDDDEEAVDQEEVQSFIDLCSSHRILFCVRVRRLTKSNRYCYSILCSYTLTQCSENTFPTHFPRFPLISPCPPGG